MFAVSERRGSCGLTLSGCVGKEGFCMHRVCGRYTILLRSRQRMDSESCFVRETRRA